MKINRNKHIWEGWTVGDFIDDIEPMFDRVTSNGGNWMRITFESKQDLKNWLKDNQPYYKKHIPEVYRYFLNKINTQ